MALTSIYSFTEFSYFTNQRNQGFNYYKNKKTIETISVQPN